MQLEIEPSTTDHGRIDSFQRVCCAKQDQPLNILRSVDLFEQAIDDAAHVTRVGVRCVSLREAVQLVDEEHSRC